MEWNALEKVDDELRELMDDMLETMHSARGIGLAAPQIDVHKRIIVVDVGGDDEDSQPICMANPEIVEVSDDDLEKIRRVGLREQELLPTKVQTLSDEYDALSTGMADEIIKLRRRVRRIDDEILVDEG